MVFSSKLFLFYFLPVFLLLYWLVPQRAKVQQQYQREQMPAQAARH